MRHDLDALEKRGELPGAMKEIRERLARLESRAAPAADDGGGALMEALLLGYLQLFRLADLLQVQVAAVEQGLAGHGGGDSDRRHSPR